LKKTIAVSTFYDFLIKIRKRTTRYLQKSLLV